MSDEKTRKRRRRRRITAEAPLELSCVVPGWREAPSRARLLAGPARVLVALLPAFKSGPSGRRLAIVTKVGIGAGAAALASLGRESLAFALLAAVVALSLLVLPLPDYKKRRLLASAERLAEPRRLPAPSPGALAYDGAKLVIRSGDRVWRSLRPRQPQHEVLVGVDADRVALGLVRPGGKRSDPLWFVTPRTAVPATYDPVATDPRYAPGDIGEVVAVDGAAWAALHEALWDPTTGGLPRPPGPARA